MQATVYKRCMSPASKIDRRPDMSHRLCLSIALTVCLFALGTLRPSAQNSASTQAPTGYLTPSEMPDVVRIVPAAPTTGDSRFTADMAIFRATRHLEGSPRWRLAQADDDLSPAGLFRVFHCALGVTLTRETAPRVTTLLTRARADASRASSVLKQFYQHKRPFQLAPGSVCVPPEVRARLAQVPDYPSGHTIAGWEVGLVLSQLAPDVATSLLTRARAFGESRIVCGVHNTSAVEAGWMTATTVFAAQNASAAFRSDLGSARAELAALRTGAPVDTAACASELKILEKDPF
jgi:acid phosphatase (class A)